MSLSGAVIVTGGAGYVGSHVVVELLQEGYHAIVIDRLNERKRECLRRIESITGQTVKTYDLDLMDETGLRKVLHENNVSSVIHLAAMKNHTESTRVPLKYYRNNVVGLTNLLTVMKEFSVDNLIYASTVAVYGTKPKCLPYDEKQKVGDNLKDAYSRTKYFCEEILKDVCLSEKEWSVMILRFFNPVGAHISGLIGEQMIEKPPNLVPNIARTAMGLQQEFIIFGGNLETRDGTGVRDYTHVVDIAKAHVAALKNIKERSGLKIYNLGTGNPCSSLQVVKAFERASGKQITYKLLEPRSYDVPASWADVSLVRKELGWKAHYDINEICTDAWRWYSKNPTGYVQKT